MGMPRKHYYSILSAWQISIHLRHY
uniref:Uncharacterized protein n=1 Tax=Anguilla anguilla TaxID=7936 RepID=A0A0E9VTA4_ANGAN